MPNTPRTTTKTSSKFYENMSVNDWNLNFEYETENNVLAKKIVVNGTKGNRSVFISKQDNQVQTVFSNGDYDTEVVTVVIAEFGAITAEYPQPPAPVAPTEG
jgi:hypothetical protein